MEAQEKKDLLFADLCARLPYGVKVVGKQDQQMTGYEVLGINKNENVVILNYTIAKIDSVNVCLRPVSSMTEEEMDKLFDILHIDKDGNDEDWIKINDVMGIKFFLPAGRWMEEIDKAMNYLRSIHIDVYDLIGKKMAVEAPDGMYDGRESDE